MNAVEIADVHEGRAGLCRDVLDDLPEWFGLPDAKAAYVETASSLPMFGGFVGGLAAGFVSLKRHTDFAVEIYVLGVRRRFHRQGIGRALIGAAADFAIARGASFLTVKTLGPSRPDPNYAATRGFYEAVGFVPIEEFPALWNADNPCLLMLKPLPTRR